MTDALTLNAAVNNLLNKDYSDVSLYSAGKSTLYAGDYFQTGSSTTGYVIPERNYWMSLNYQSDNNKTLSLTVEYVAL